jgi:two-component system chemotaxis sensor kinase CheA
MAKRLDCVFHDINEDNLRLTLLAAELQDSINRIRMLPISTLFNHLPRLLRDISRELGKEVTLVTDGAWIQLDKRILEGLKDPLVHLVRNCVDHGVEGPEGRREAGKDLVGRVTLKAYQKGANVFLEIEDDGRGIDLEKVRRVAEKRKIIPAGAEIDLPDTQLMQLIFHPGFSTKEIITDISGRGVGLDIVLSNIEALKGSITVRSKPGLGTRFTIKLPLTLATTQALLVSTAGETLAIPVTAVEVTRVITPEEVTSIEGREALLLDGRPILLVDLARVLGYGESPVRRREIPVVVLSSTDDEVAFAVDQLIGEQEVIIKPLGGQLRKVANFSGATLLGDGKVSLIINVFDLVKSARKLAGTSVAPKRVDLVEARTRSIMVVDDSITTRTMERNLLEAAGYRVVTASDGLDAFTKLEKEPVDLLVADVEMPRMDGFELTASVKKSDRLKKMPVILVTSLDSEEDRRKGIELGADAYITKKTFDHGDLIRVVEQLI